MKNNQNRLNNQIKVILLAFQPLIKPLKLILLLNFKIMIKK